MSVSSLIEDWLDLFSNYGFSFDPLFDASS